MRSSPALSPRVLVALTVAGQPPRDSTQRRLTSWLGGRLADAADLVDLPDLLGALRVFAEVARVFVEAARFFVDADRFVGDAARFFVVVRLRELVAARLRAGVARLRSTSF